MFQVDVFCVAEMFLACSRYVFGLEIKFKLVSAQLSEL